MVKIKVAAARKNAQLTQAAAAKQIGCSIGTLSNYETGKTFPNRKRLEVMSKVYGIPVEMLE